MKAYDVLTVGEPMALFSALAPGPLEEVTDWQRSIAGAELNVAIGLARLGPTVAYLSRVGQDSFGRSVPSPQAMASAIKCAQADLVLPGLAEARVLTGQQRPEEIAAWYLDHGAQQVAITKMCISPRPEPIQQSPGS